MPLPSPLPVALTIAGSDSGGGAGIQADLKTFHRFGVFGTSAVTAVTVQDTRGVRDVHAVPVEVVVGQIDVVVDDLAPRAVKSGMLVTRPLVEGVATALDRHRLPAFVLDPVMVATSGDPLLANDAVEAVRTLLLPLATVVTPNTDEAEILTGDPVRNERELRQAARTLVAQGARAALVKGGHLDGPEAIDILWDGTREWVWRHPRLITRHTHGTGCTLSAAIAAGLAKGHDLPRATGDAIGFVAEALKRAPGLGKGHGPLDHFAPIPGEASAG